VTAGERTSECVFCEALKRAEADDSLVVHVAALNFVVMNLFPYNSGHLMIAPRRHVGTLQGATPQELDEMIALARRLEAVTAEVYRPDGVNLGMNLGKPAGAGVAEHIHLHFVPRWSGDTNFMSVVGEVRVLPESLAETWAKLRPRFA